MSLTQPLGAGKHFGLDIMRNMEFLFTKRRILVSLALFLLAGCVAAETATPAPASPFNLAAYATQTIPAIPTLAGTVSTIATPTVPTPTPAAYTLQQGDTLLGIAQRSGILLAELLAANPGITPEALTVGQVIQIPAAREQEPLSLPGAASVGEVTCFPSGEGLYCLVPVKNTGDGALENLKVQITLLDAQGRLVTSGEALPPLTSLPTGKTLPATIFFPNIKNYQISQAQLLTAIQTTGERTLPAKIKDLLVSIAWGGLSAQVSGKVWLPPASNPARLIWLAGVAYDVNGNILGVRRWEWEGAVGPDEYLPFTFAVYSTGAPIHRVEVVLEARP